MFLVLLALSVASQTALGFVVPRHGATLHKTTRHHVAAVDEATSSKTADVDALLNSVKSGADTAMEWSKMFELGEQEAAFYGLFHGIRESIPLGLRGKPFVINQRDVVKAIGLKDDSPFAGYFCFDDIEKALDDDFLDAGRGSTDNQKGWKMTTVSTPRGQSFEEARMTLEDVEAALEKGTVIFNSAGAHIPKLARATLACVDSMALPNALNMYVTAPGKRTSAPPHTDRQDVVVVQTSGKKHWRVFSPPITSIKPSADMFARGKGDDNLPIYTFEEDYGCELLLETTLEAGDVMFMPAGFPHTTDTAKDGLGETSIHLTFGIDTHIWDLDYLSLRCLALERACVKDDSGLGTRTEQDDTRYVGKLNLVDQSIRNDLCDALPMGFLEEDCSDGLVDKVAGECERMSKEVDSTSASAMEPDAWKEATERIQQHGKDLLEIHRDMYLESIEVGRIREDEAAMTAHLGKEHSGRKALSPEQMQRLSVFRVKKQFDKIADINKSLQEWTLTGRPSSDAAAAGSAKPSLPENWAFTSPLKIGDEVEADLGGAWFPAKVTRAAGNVFDVQFFDGDRETGLDRSMIKLTTPPAVEEEVDTSKMTPKQLKRWKKQQKKKNK